MTGLMDTSAFRSDAPTGRTFVIGDLHGAYKALLQCLKRSGFDRDRDRLISLGDICDGYPQVDLCVEELLELKRFDLVIGNHDLCALAWAERGETSEEWLRQGGENTILSYGGGPMPRAHAEFFKRGKKYLEIGTRLFVHAGYDPELPAEVQDIRTFAWGRGLVEAAKYNSHKGDETPFGSYSEIFLGHTPTVYLDAGDRPAKFANVWAIDTGAGWDGRLTIMDIDSHEYWQSDRMPFLYPGVVSRRG
jgi:serine/threonine protein phosphatase 1